MAPDWLAAATAAMEATAAALVTGSALQGWAMAPETPGTAGLCSTARGHGGRRVAVLAKLADHGAQPALPKKEHSQAGTGDCHGGDACGAGDGLCGAGLADGAGDSW